MSISLFRAIAHQYQCLRRINTVPMMNVISHQIEDQIIRHQLSVDLFAGFQRFSSFQDQHRRYARLGAICRRVYVFGVADYQAPIVPGVEFIEIAPTSALSKEWFLLVDTPDFWTTLVAKEVEGQDYITGGRRFDGLWSFDDVVVDRISLLVSQIMELPYQPVQQRYHSRQNAHITEVHSRMLDSLEGSEISRQRRWVQLQTLKHIAEICAGNPLELLHKAARILKTIFGTTGVVIAIRTANERCTIAAVEGEATGKGWKVPLSQGLIGRAVQQGRLIQIFEVSRNHEKEPLLPTAKSLIAVPMINRRVHGAVAVSNSEPGRWNEEDAQTLMTVARILAIQLEQAIQTAKNNGGTPEVPISGLRM